MVDNVLLRNQHDGNCLGNKRYTIIVRGNGTLAVGNISPPFAMWGRTKVLKDSLRKRDDEDKIISKTFVLVKIS